MEDDGAMDMNVEQVRERLMNAPPNEREYWEAELLRQQASSKRVQAMVDLLDRTHDG